MKSIFKIILPIFLFVSILIITNSSEAYLSPLKQYESGVLAPNIHCNENLVLIYKLSDQSPRCVKEKTSAKLENRGFTTEFVYSNQITSDPKIIQQRSES